MKVDRVERRKKIKLTGVNAEHDKEGGKKNNNNNKKKKTTTTKKKKEKDKAE